MILKLSILSIPLGLIYGAPWVLGLVQPDRFAAAARKFPRSLPWGVALMLLGTAWFLYNLSQESIADFAAFKNLLLLGFAAIGLGSCIFVQDFLAVRGLAVVLLLLAKLMVDSGRVALSSTSWALVIQVLAYVFVLAGMWLTISPWRMRDFLNWLIGMPGRLKLVCGLNAALAVFLIVLGLLRF